MKGRSRAPSLLVNGDYPGYVSETPPPHVAVNAATSSQPAGPAPTVLYSERQWVPVWWWLAALAVAGLLAAEVHMGAPGLRAWLPYVLLLPLPIWAMLWLGRHRVQVVYRGDDTYLEVGGASLPVSVISRVAAVPASAKSAALGRQLDPAAFLQHRVWIGPLVLVVLDDEDDPTPYWLVSSRRAEKLVEVLETARGPRV
ncbi:MAG: DUF3093 domain-containing protein [Rhodococcus sp.]|nr:DUF3093 domain-containing protein [Rhodococcus sp. (in: high G+C Gram-positive bacteria)]